MYLLKVKVMQWCVLVILLALENVLGCVFIEGYPRADELHDPMISSQREGVMRRLLDVHDPHAGEWGYNWRQAR
jgi:hypothetical protein